MRLDPLALPAPALEFLTERHLATLTTLRADRTPHVVAVGFTWDPDAGLARVITAGTSQKAVNLRGGGRAVVAQVDGRRWLALEGPAVVTAEPARVAAAVERYSARYRDPRPNPGRVAIEMTVDRVLGWVPEA